MIWCTYDVCGDAGGRHYGSGDSWSLGSGIGSYYGGVEDGGFYGRPPYNAVRSTRDLLVSVDFSRPQEILW